MAQIKYINKKAKEILDFFNILPLKDIFYPNEIIEDRIRNNFIASYFDASEGKFDDWTENPLESAALSALFGIVPFTIFKLSSLRVETLHEALEIGQYVCKKKIFQYLNKNQKAIVFAPFCWTPNKHKYEEEIKIFLSVSAESYQYLEKFKNEKIYEISA